MVVTVTRVETRRTLGLTDTAYVPRGNPVDEQCDWRDTGTLVKRTPASDARADGNLSVQVLHGGTL